MSSVHAAFLDGAFTRSGDAITFVRNGVFIDCNAAVLRMFGYTDKAEFLAQTPWTISPEMQANGEPSHIASQRYMAAAAREGHVLFEWLHQRKDGSVFPAEVMIVLFQLDGDEALAVTVRDITKRKSDEAEIVRQREALHQSEKLAAIGSLLAGVAHELNNPLSIVINHAVILQDLSADPATQARAAKIEQAAGRCAKIVKSFLAVARKKTPTYGPVSAAEVIDKALELTSYGLRSRGIALDVAVDPTCPALLADEDQMIQVITNLIVNAQQALEGVAGGRRMQIGARCNGEGGLVRLSLHDSGPGVPDALRPRIFDPFFTTKAAGEGTGIGLALCRNIVEAHGGTITVASSPLGGARFDVSVPADTRSAVEAGHTEQPAAELAGVRILVVEDEPELAALLQDILRPSARRLDRAPDGQAALALIARHRYDVVISDLQMPVMDGQALHGALRNAGSFLADRMIFLSGDLLSGRNAAFLAATDNPYLEKPFTPTEVRAAVEAVLASGASPPRS